MAETRCLFELVRVMDWMMYVSQSYLRALWLWSRGSMTDYDDLQLITLLTSSWLIAAAGVVSMSNWK